MEEMGEERRDTEQDRSLAHLSLSPMGVSLVTVYEAMLQTEPFFIFSLLYSDPL